MENKERVMFWDILKGLAVLSIVLGYSRWQIQPYVYTYHIALLFFTGAYFYKEEKYINRPFEYAAKLFQKNWCRYLFYMVLFILLHNFNVRFGLYEGLEYYSVYETIKQILSAVVFSCYELFGGAMWFILVGIVTGSMMAVLVTFCNKASLYVAKTDKTRKCIKYILLIIITVILASVAPVKQTLAFNMQLAYLLLPVCIAAYFISKISDENYKKYLNFFVALAFGGLIFVLVKYTGYRVDISMNVIPLKPWYYVLVFMGIYVCMTLAKYIEKVPYVNRFFAFLGKQAFAIIALELFVIKLCDRAYGFILGEKNPAVFAKWINAYSDALWWLYIILGTVLPAIFGYLLDNAVKVIKQKNIAKNEIH